MKERAEQTKLIFEKEEMLKNLLKKNLTDSGYETTSVLMQKKDEVSMMGSIKSLVAVAKLKESISVSPIHKKKNQILPKKKVITQAMRRKSVVAEKRASFTNFSNLIDRRKKIKKYNQEIVTMKTIKEIKIIPLKKKTKKEREMEGRIGKVHWP